MCSYQVADAALGAKGRNVSCGQCDARWFVAAPADKASERVAEIRAEAHSERSRPASYAELYGTAALPKAAHRRTLTFPRIAPAVAVVLALTALPSALIAARLPLVRHVPQLGGIFAAMGLPANLRGLSLAGVATHRGGGGREAFLDVEGEIANVRAGTTPLPPLRLTIIDAAGQPIYGWTEPAPKPHLDAGEHVTFHARLVTPPPAGTKVIVRFASAAEAAGTR